VCRHPVRSAASIAAEEGGSRPASGRRVAVTLAERGGTARSRRANRRGVGPGTENCPMALGIRRVLSTETEDPRVMKGLLASLLVAVALAGCASKPPSREAAPQTVECTDPGGWAPWLGGISASGSQAFCAGRPRR
jgi:hypothetical protein